MDKRQLFHVKYQKSTSLDGRMDLFGHNYRVTALSLYLTVIGIIIQSLKSIGQF